MRTLPISLALCLAALATACSRDESAAVPDSAAGTVAQAQDTALVRADKARIQGSESAKVWMIIASDFQCPYCKQFKEETYKQILKDYVAAGKIRVAFLNHPMSFHPNAIPAAEAAMCAGTQDRFWPMHDKLFETQERWSKLGNPQAVFDSLATSLSLRMESWRGCVTTHKTRPMVDSDFARSRAGGVEGTPSFFIGNRLAIVGVEPYANFRAALDAAIAGGRGGQPR
jgi:protein-disulfide isomerase